MHLLGIRCVRHWKHYTYIVYNKCNIHSPMKHSLSFHYN
jgi:hypothetical protein